MLFPLILAAAYATASPATLRPQRPDAGPSKTDTRRQLAALSSTDAARQVQQTSSSEQFGAAFAYGEGAGLHEDLQGLLRRSQDLPVGLVSPFMQGAAHTWAPPAQIPMTTVVHQIDKQLPLEHRDSFYTGVFISLTIASSGDPALVVPHADLYQTLRGRWPLDGIRIGLQRALGDNMSLAIETASRYPKRYQTALYEELGWRAGNNGSEGCALVTEVPEANRCAFVHGMARGRTLNAPWETMADATTAGETIRDAACGCEPAVWRGAAWGLALRWGHRPDHARTLARRVDDTVSGAQIETPLRALLQSERLPPWEGIDETNALSARSTQPAEP